MSVIQVPLPQQAIAAFCKKWRISELALFGSVLRDDFRPDSDVDVLVTFEPCASWSLWNVIEAEDELRDIIGRPVDLVDRRTVEMSDNWIRRQSILGSARTIHGR